jgi:hypothetical protein
VRGIGAVGHVGVRGDLPPAWLEAGGRGDGNGFPGGVHPDLFEGAEATIDARTTEDDVLYPAAAWIITARTG